MNNLIALKKGTSWFVDNNYFFPFAIEGAKFMRSLAQDGAVDEETLSTGELDNMFSPLREQVSDSVHRQETLVSQIQVRPSTSYIYCNMSRDHNLPNEC